MRIMVERHTKDPTHGRAIVVGAGLAGLSAAHELERDGVDVTVLEASDRVGGRVWSVPFGDLGTIERGAEFVLPGATALLETIARLDLPLAVKGMTYGNREPRGGEPVTTDEIAAAMEELPERAAASRTVRDALAGLPPAVAAALEARAAISCTYRVDDLDARELLATTSHLGDYDTRTVVGGNRRIADGLAASLRRSVRLDTRASAIAEGPDGVTVATSAGELTADAVVVAVPARVIDEIAFTPALPDAKRAASLRFGHAAKLFVRLAEPAPPSATLSVPGRFWCFTQLRPDGTPLPILGSLAGSEEALRALDVDAGPDRWLDAIGALRPDLAIDRSQCMLATWHDAPHVRALQVARSVAQPMDDEALSAPRGRLAFAGEHTAGAVWHGTMEGAIRSGRRAAEDVARMLAHGAPVAR